MTAFDHETNLLKAARCAVDVNGGALEVTLPDGRHYTHWVRSGWNQGRKGSKPPGSRGIRWLVIEAGRDRGVTKKKSRIKRSSKIRMKTRVYISWLLWASFLGAIAGWQLCGLWKP